MRTLPLRRLAEPRWLNVLWLLSLLSSPSVASLETGRLNIRSQPEVEVIWEGAALGSTNAAGVMAISGIPQGSYWILLTKSGFEDRRIEVQIGAGDNELVVDLVRRAPPPSQESKEVASSTASPPAPPAVTASGDGDSGRKQQAPMPPKETEAELDSAPPVQPPVDTHRPDEPPSELNEETRASPLGGPAWRGVAFGLSILALGLFLVLRYRRRQQQSYEPHPAPPVPDIIGPITVRKTENPQEFLSTLRRTESEMERGATGRRLIDLESLEAGPNEEKP
jgi:hypothetical protein